MGRAPCCSKVGLQKGPWSTNEDKLLTDYIQANGEGQWRSLPKKAGLLRCGKSCRLRWMNYLRPGIKRGNITADEEDLIIRLQSLLGNRWSLIAGRLPGRTDNEVKNHWNTHLLKRLKKEGIEPKKTHNTLTKKSSKGPKKKQAKKNPVHVNNNNNTTTTSTTSTDQGGHEEKVSNDNYNMTEVYVPRPIKVCSGFTPSNSLGSVVSGNTNNSSSNQEEVEEEEVVDKLQGEEAKTSQVSDISWSSFELDDQSQVRRIEISDKNQILFDYDCDLSLQGVAPVSDNLLDKVYDEYLQLL